MGLERSAFFILCARNVHFYDKKTCGKRRKPLYLLVGRAGIEPATHGLRVLFVSRSGAVRAVLAVENAVFCGQGGSKRTKVIDKMCAKNVQHSDTADTFTLVSEQTRLIRRLVEIDLAQGAIRTMQKRGPSNHSG